MHRVQLQLTAQQVRDLRDEAERSGLPVAALVREAVDAWLEARRRRELWDRALSAVGKFRSGLGDVAERHDDYLAGEIAERKVSR